MTQIIREIHQMGPDGQPMDYSGVSRPNQVNVQGGDYVQAGSGYGTNPRPHYPPGNPPDHVAYDPALMQDPYYGRATLPPEAAGIVHLFPFLLILLCLIRNYLHLTINPYTYSTIL